VLPDTASSGGNGNVASSELERNVPLSLSKGEPSSAPAETPTFVTLELPEDRLAWTVQYLEEARFGGLIAHLMLVRALFPDGASADGATPEVRRHAAVLSELIDRLFVKLRMPGVELQPADLETAASRKSLKALIAALRRESSSDVSTSQQGLRLVGVVEPGELTAAARSLDRDRLVTAAPWRAATTLLGTSLQRDGTEVADFSPYRDALLRAFEGMRDLSPTEFEAALHEPGDVELEVERETVLRALAEQRRVTA
jgi:hypothetical protein